MAAMASVAALPSPEACGPVPVVASKVRSEIETMDDWKAEVEISPCLPAEFQRVVGSTKKGGPQNWRDENLGFYQCSLVNLIITSDTPFLGVSINGDIPSYHPF